VTLQSPGGKSVDLHRQEGGSTDNLIMTYDFVNCPSLESLIHEPIAGRWKFLVKDLAGQDRGKLNRWGLRVEREG
jgi:subtilisin-like proprotein convertase family protein